MLTPHQQKYTITRNCYSLRRDFYRLLKDTAHKTIFLILYEMGMDDKDVRRIMGITQEAIRSTRYRILQNGKK